MILTIRAGLGIVPSFLLEITVSWGRSRSSNSPTILLMPTKCDNQSFIVMTFLDITNSSLCCLCCYNALSNKLMKFVLWYCCLYIEHSIFFSQIHYFTWLQRMMFIFYPKTLGTFGKDCNVFIWFQQPSRSKEWKSCCSHQISTCHNKTISGIIDKYYIANGWDIKKMCRITFLQHPYNTLILLFIASSDQ